MSTLYGVDTSPAFQRINALRADQRDAAYDIARQRIAGRKPAIEDFQAHRIAKYPREFAVLITVMAAFMVIVAFVPSAIRIHQVALDNFALAIGDATSQYFAALCVVLMAETGQIIFSLASMRSEGRGERWGYTIAALISTGIALTGNAVAVGDHAFANGFAFLETFAPPVLTLITATVLKRQVLNAVADRHQANARYQDALERWQDAVENAEQNAGWKRALANALRDALRSANSRSSAQLRELTQSDWFALVMREQSSEEWYDSEAQRVEDAARRLAIAPSPVRNGERSTEATGEIAAIPTQRNASGQYTKECSVCGYVAIGDTPRSATNRLVAHQKRHANEARRIAVALSDRNVALETVES